MLELFLSLLLLLLLIVLVLQSVGQQTTSKAAPDWMMWEIGEARGPKAVCLCVCTYTYAHTTDVTHNEYVTE